MTRADLAAGLRLCRLSNWNQLEDDWLVFLDRGSAFVAVEGEEVVGSVAQLPFGSDFTWLSMMLVDPASRRSGIGTRLMEAVLEEIGPDACVRLDATPLGEPLYRRFGFVDEYPLARTRAAADAAAHRPSPDAQPIDRSDLPAIFARDREVFGADRSALLAELFRRAPDLAWRTRRAYCFGRPGYLHPQIGPLVADDRASASELLGHCLAVRAQETFLIDIARRPDGLDLPVERPFLRMSRGQGRDHGSPSAVFAITGPEFG